MYEVFLFTHSWFRWIVVITGIRIIFLTLRGWIQNKAWDASDARALSQFNEVLLYQIGMGIALYGFLSPLPKIGWQDMPSSFHDPILRFWTMEHPIGMLSALCIFHIGRMLTLKKIRIESRHKAIFITLMLTLIVILCTIPWPFLKHGRDLFRFYF